MAEKKCVFAGSFDPPTQGHKALIEDCLRLFDEVAVAVMINPEKRPYFSEKEREDMLRLMFPKEERLKIVFFSGTAAELLERENTKIFPKLLTKEKIRDTIKIRKDSLGNDVSTGTEETSFMKSPFFERTGAERRRARGRIWAIKFISLISSR